MKVWAFKYNDCIYESAYATISLHESKEGAENAMIAHKDKKKSEFDEMYKDEPDNDIEFGSMERWYVDEVEVLP